MNTRLEERLQLQHRCMREFNFFYRRVALGFQLSESAFWILYALSDSNKEYSQQLLCDEWFLPKQTVNSAIKCLIKKKMIYLEHVHPTYIRKQKVIRLTLAGKLFITENIERFRNAEREAFGNMTEQEQDDFICLIQKQTCNLKKLVNL